MEKKYEIEDGRWIHRYAFWNPTTWAMPQLYWDEFSGEQRIHAITRQLAKLIAYGDYLGTNTDELTDIQKELQSEFEEFKASGFFDYYAEQIEQWVNDHAEILFTDLAKQVYFGLTLDGHFVAYIPESWDDIIFDTGYVWGEDTYGRLILRWDVDDSGESVNQRPENWQ